MQCCYFLGKLYNSILISKYDKKIEKSGYYLLLRKFQHFHETCLRYAQNQQAWTLLVIMYTQHYHNHSLHNSCKSMAEKIWYQHVGEVDLLSTAYITSWLPYDMEMLSVLLALCEGNPLDCRAFMFPFLLAWTSSNHQVVCKIYCNNWTFTRWWQIRYILENMLLLALNFIISIIVVDIELFSFSRQICNQMMKSKPQSSNN